MKTLKPLLKFPNGRLIVIDVDTTGKSPYSDSLIAIHAVEIKDSKFTGNFFHTFINRRSYNQDYMYYLAEYNYCLNVKKKLKLFLDFAKGATIVSHNIRFDIGFINEELKKNSLNETKIDECVCTMSILKNFLVRYNLNNSALLYGIQIKKDDYHKGIIDAVVLGRIVCKMTKNNDINYNFFEYYKKNGQMIEEGVKENNENKEKKERNEIRISKTRNEKNENKEKNEIKERKEINEIRISKARNENENKVIKEIINEIKKKNEIVYISRTGKRYHLYKKCGNMQDPLPSSVKEAEKMERTPCLTCTRIYYNREFI